MRPWIRLLVASLALVAGQTTAQTDPNPTPATGKAEGFVLGPLGEPMRGVVVRAVRWTAPDVVLAEARTDGEGMFVLTRLPLESVSVLATAPGLTTAWSTVSLSTARPEGGESLRLWPANAVRGRVVDGQGKPVAGALVLGSKDFTWFEGGFRSPEATTDEDGRFALEGIPTGDQVVRVWAPGFVMLEHRLVTTEDVDLALSLQRGEDVRISVHAKGVRPEDATEVAVWIYPTRDGSGFSFPRALERDGHLDAEGRWILAGMPDCEWHVQLRSDRYAFDPPRAQAEPGGAHHELTFTATPIGALQLRGTLRDEEGRPLAGETLVSRTQNSQSMNGGTPGRCATDDDGRFVLDAPLSRGERYSLHLEGSRHVLVQDKVEGHTGNHDARYLVRYEDRADPERELDLVARPAAFVRGRARDDLGAPLAFRWCTLRVLRGTQWTALAHTYSLRDGSIAFPGVHALDLPARIGVSLNVGGASSEDFTIAGLGDQEIEVRAPAMGRVHGRVVDAKGQPLIGARLQIQNHHLDSGRQIDGSWTRVMTDRDGRYVFLGVAPTGHRVTLVDAQDDDLLVSELFGVGPGEDVEVDLQAPAGN